MKEMTRQVFRVTSVLLPPARPILVVLLGLLLSSGATLAHDMWIVPAQFTPATGELLKIGLRLGHPGGKEEVVVRDSSRIEIFNASFSSRQDQAGSEMAVVGLDGANPAGLLPLGESGLLSIAYRSQGARSILAAEPFERYLREEGLEQIVAYRMRVGESTAAGRESYSRSLKALVAVGEDSERTQDHPLGLPLEIVAGANPYALSPGSELPLRLLYMGEAQGGVLVEAASLQDPRQVLQARSDAQGRLAFRLPAAGVWVLSAVHMVRAEEDPEVDWRSIWTALTFSIPEAAERVAEVAPSAAP